MKARITKSDFILLKVTLEIISIFVNQALSLPFLFTHAYIKWIIICTIRWNIVYHKPWCLFRPLKLLNSLSKILMIFRIKLQQHGLNHIQKLCSGPIWQICVYIVLRYELFSWKDRSLPSQKGSNSPVQRVHHKARRRKRGGQFLYPPFPPP